MASNLRSRDGLHFVCSQRSSLKTLSGWVFGSFFSSFKAGVGTLGILKPRNWGTVRFKPPPAPGRNRPTDGSREGVGHERVTSRCHRSCPLTTRLRVVEVGCFLGRHMSFSSVRSRSCLGLSRFGPQDHHDGMSREQTAALLDPQHKWLANHSRL